MILPGGQTKVHVAIEPVDFRCGMDSLAILVADQLSRDPFSGHVFAFCNRSRTSVKLLWWDRNGFWLCQKRLERERFAWPKSASQVEEWGERELRWLVDGLEVTRVVGHQEVHYQTIL